MVLESVDLNVRYVSIMVETRGRRRNFFSSISVTFIVCLESSGNYNVRTCIDKVVLIG